MSDAKQGPNWLLWGCLGVPAFLGAVALVLTLVGYRAFMQFAVSDDLTKFQELVRKSDLPPDAQQPLIERLERLRERARHGAPIGFWHWVDYQSSMKALLDDGKITPDKAAAFDRELGRMERDYGLQEAAHGR